MGQTGQNVRDLEAREQLKDIARVFLTRHEAAAAVGLSSDAFIRMVKDGMAPQPVKFSQKRQLWYAKTLDEWAADLDAKAQRLAQQAG